MCSLTEQEIVFVAQYCCETNSYTLATIMDLFQNPPNMQCVYLKACDHLKTNFYLKKGKALL